MTNPITEMHINCPHTSPGQDPWATTVCSPMNTDAPVTAAATPPLPYLRTVWVAADLADLYLHTTTGITHLLDVRRDDDGFGMRRILDLAEQIANLLGASTTVEGEVGR